MQNNNLLFSQNLLLSKIRFAFGSVDFPRHCGWHAAIAKDNWVSDPSELLRITNIKDKKCNWWELSIKDLKFCSIAQCYLDAQGVAFYLPAYMSCVVRKTVRPMYCHLVSWLTPGINDHDARLYDYFVERFSLIDERRKSVCIEVLHYIKLNLDPNDRFSEQEIDQILKHKF